MFSITTVYILYHWSEDSVPAAKLLVVIILQPPLVPNEMFYTAATTAWFRGLIHSRPL